MKKLIILCILVCTLFGCATGYQSSGFGGGYSETQLNQDMFNVRFRGNGYTSEERASDFCLLRCAELCKTNGYNYFIIIDSKSSATTATYTTPTYTKTNVNVYSKSAKSSSVTYGGETYEISKPRTENTIICTKEKPEGINYNAEFLIKSIKEKYNIN